MTDQPARPDGPTELVDDGAGEMVERLSGGTATLLLAWLIGVGGLSTLLGAWIFFWIVTGQRLGLGALFSGFGLYTGLAGAAGPCVLWLTGRAQGHTLGWFVVTGVKIAMVMVAIVVIVLALAILVLAGSLPGIGAVAAAGLMAVMAVLLAVVWGVATWAADRWIARARVSESDQTP